MRRLFLALISISLSLGLSAQELRCNVQVVSSQIQGSNVQIFQTMQNAIYEFMNNRVWTDHVYAMEERIECNLMINLTEKISADEFKGTLTVQATRPVYNSAYKTAILNFVDADIHINYVEFSPLEFDLNSHSSNLTSILAFYAYYIIGLDYDTFSLNGGTPYFNNAERIAINAENASESGWKPMDDIAHKNRYWMIKDRIDIDYAPLREFMYRYHRLGLDLMDENVVDGRSEITNSMELLQQVYRKRPDPYMYPIKLLLDSKADEIISIYSESYPEEKNRVHAILIEVDKASISKYKAILE